MQTKPLRLLALGDSRDQCSIAMNIAHKVITDGGGIRGLSELVILSEMMKRIEVDQGLTETPRPCNYFDLIGGTGTGGLNALLLGRLRLTADDAIQNYLQFARQVFGEKKWKGKDGLFKATNFEKAIKDIIKASTGCADELMMDHCCSEMFCHTFVCAMPVYSMSVPHLFRTYRVRENQTYDCMIWEAARATCASPSLFKRIAIGEKDFKDEFIDAGMRYNNPVKLVLEEAVSVFGPSHPVACVISLGCGQSETIGLPSPNIFQRVLPFYLLSALKNMSNDCETASQHVEKRLENGMRVYFRFNVQRGLGQVSLAEWTRLGEVTQHTKQYLQEITVNHNINESVAALQNRLETITAGELSGLTSRKRATWYQGVGMKARLRPSAMFTGRDDILEKLSDFFNTSSLNVQKQSIFVLYGLGGSGKTEIALKFLDLHAEKFSFAFHLDASTMETMKTTLEDLALQNGLKTMGDALNYLSYQQEEWLLLFDNFDDPKLNLWDFIPPCHHGNILVTTRNKECCQLAPQSNFEVASMACDEAAQLLLKCAMVPPCEEAMVTASSVAQELGYLALAIVQAGRYISQSCTLADYLGLYQRYSIGIFQEDAGQRVHNYKSTICTTWNMSFRRLNTTAQMFLFICSFFHYDGIAQGIFKKAIMHINRVEEGLYPLAVKFLQEFQSECGDWDERRFFNVIRELGVYSLVNVNREKKVFSIHPLVHAWSKEQIPAEERAKVMGCTMQILSLSVESASHDEDFKFMRTYICHVETLYTAEILDAVVAGSFSKVMKHCGNWKKAENFQNRVYTLRRNFLGEEHPDTLTSLNDLTLIYESQGRFTEAETLQVQVLGLRKKIFGEEHPDTLTTMASLASTHDSQGQFSKSEMLQVQVLELRKKILGDEHPDTLSSMNMLALTYHGQGQFSKSEMLQLHVLELKKKILGEEHPDTLTGINNLASTHHDQGQFAKAEILQLQVLELRKKILGEEHPSTVGSMNTLALTYHSQGQFQKAKILQMQVLGLRKRILGDHHPDTLISMNNLSLTYDSQGQFSKAEILQVQVLDLTKKILGDKHPDTLISMASLASTYHSQGQFSKAELLQVQVLNLTKKILGDEHPDTLISMASLASTYHSQGQFSKAELLQLQVLELSKSMLGEEHPDTLISMTNLASTYHGEGQFSKAEMLQVQVFLLRKKILGEEHPDTMISMNNLSLTYESQGQFQKAETLQVQVLELRKKILGEEHPHTLISMASLSSTYESQGQFSKAEMLQLDVLDLSKKILGEEHPDTLISMASLASTYQSQGQFSKAELLQVQVLELSKRIVGEEFPDTLISMATLASTYQSQGHFSKAEMLQVPLLELLKKILGEEHPYTLTTMSNLLLTYESQGQLSKAETLKMEVLKLRKNMEEHPDTLSIIL